MSKDNAVRFMRQVGESDALRDRLEREVHSGDTLSSFAAGLGYRFTPAEAREAVEQLAPAPGAELTPEQLDMVAGGVSLKYVVGVIWTALGGGGGDSWQVQPGQGSAGAPRG